MFGMMFAIGSTSRTWINLLSFVIVRNSCIIFAQTTQHIGSITQWFVTLWIFICRNQTQFNSRFVITLRTCQRRTTQTQQFSAMISTAIITQPLAQHTLGVVAAARACLALGGARKVAWQGTGAGRCCIDGVQRLRVARVGKFRVHETCSFPVPFARFVVRVVTCALIEMLSSCFVFTQTFQRQTTQKQRFNIARVERQHTTRIVQHARVIAGVRSTVRALQSQRNGGSRIVR
mmetsp:Transcript_21270/g.36274  ORF Transcript_21270/g.36274 Transcript_21270/m.36274 type:complete len:233 (-) Transcript_21270:471-1169(-)